MNRGWCVSVVVSLALVVAGIGVPAASRRRGAGIPRRPQPNPLEDYKPLLKQVLRHLSQRADEDGRAPARLVDLLAVQQDPELWEKVVRKVRRGHDAAGRHAGAAGGGAQGSRHAGSRHGSIVPRRAAPNPGRPLVHRLNRAEYANAIRDLLALDIDPATCCRPTIRARDSTTSPTCSACRRCCSRAISQPPIASARSRLAIRRRRRASEVVPRPSGRLAVASRRGAAARNGRRIRSFSGRCRSTASTSSRSGCFARTSARCVVSSSRISSRSASMEQRVHLASFGGDKDVIELERQSDADR